LTKPNFDNKTLLITGGTGSFGRKFVNTLLRQSDLAKLIVFSRDELKQMEMASEIDSASIRFFIGDVRDKDRLQRAMQGVDYVIHAAALKQVPACEYNPMEAVKTNVFGAQNIIDASIDQGVEKVIALSTDKAVNPINIYGATKLCAEKLFIQANSYSGIGRTRFSCVRYGNVVGSRGSVIPVFRSQADTGTLTITDERMTRFWITLEQGVQFVISCLADMQGAEVFVPKISSMRIVDLAEAIAPGCSKQFVGIRPGEKLHEVLISSDESRTAIDLGDRYVIMPINPWFAPPIYPESEPVVDGFEYRSDTNSNWVSSSELVRMVED